MDRAIQLATCWESNRRGLALPAAMTWRGCTCWGFLRPVAPGTRQTKLNRFDGPSLAGRFGGMRRRLQSYCTEDAKLMLAALALQLLCTAAAQSLEHIYDPLDLRSLVPG